MIRKDAFFCSSSQKGRFFTQLTAVCVDPVWGLEVQADGKLALIRGSMSRRACRAKEVFHGAAPFLRGGKPNTYLEAHEHGIHHILE